MTYDAGRVRHAMDLMHYSKASNGSSIPSNWIPAATGDSGVGWQPQSGGGSVSYGSNSSAVSEISIVGVATTVARSDHYHAGVNNITSSSSNTLQRGTVNFRPGAGIAFSDTDTDGDGEFDTLTISATGGGGGGGGSGTLSTVEEVDGSPTDSAVTKLVFPNGTLSITSHVATYTAASGSFTTYDSLIGAMSGLVHRWKFEDASGNFADSVGSLTLTKSGTITYGVTGGPVSGGAGSITFGASGQGVSSGLGSIPVGNTARTFVLVYKGKSSTSKQALLSYGTSGSTRQWWTGFLNDSGGATNDSLGFALWADDIGMLNTNLNVETWHIVAFGYDAAQTAWAWIDGRFHGRRLGGTLNTGSGGNFFIGIDTTSGNQLGAVTFDDLAVFSRSLDPYELTQLYSALVGALP